MTLGATSEVTSEATSPRVGPYASPARGRTLVTNALVLGTSGTPEPAQILVRDGQIETVAFGGESLTGTDAQVIDVGGALVTPGMIDLHVHLREPGQEYKETIASGTRAAARGGWTTVCAMPNTDPDPHSPELLRDLRQRIADSAVIRVLPYAPITRGLVGSDLVDADAMVAAGAVGFSNDGRGVQTAAVMAQIMTAAARLGVPVATHAEDESLKGGGVINDGAASRRLDLPGIHRLAETVQVARDALIAEATGAHHHVCHVSTVEAIRIVARAQADGANVTAEATPHHLLLDDDMIATDNAQWKVNPPLRTKRDAEALLDALRDGTVTVIATDNAPHAPHEKHCSFIDGAFGMVGNEYTFALLYTYLVRTGKLPLATLVRALTTGPAEAYHLPGGTLAAGAPADLAAFDLNSDVVIDADSFVGIGRNTPFIGRRVAGDCVWTMCAGHTVHSKLC